MAFLWASNKQGYAKLYNLCFALRNFTRHSLIANA